MGERTVGTTVRLYTLLQKGRRTAAQLAEEVFGSKAGKRERHTVSVLLSRLKGAGLVTSPEPYWEVVEKEKEPGD